MYHIHDSLFTIYSVTSGLDDWEVKIADFGVLLGKDAKNVLDAVN